eukprot:TRINITY_DN10553_c0_g1_i1.p1 TRINITY_DN10553_c0_g1~~TRINITY_DN10553_c0_g1_i1.p1  ORF type:complete len:168 (-),score=37.07 TRINITY_DN10553_c0_g1_i1:58-561(-)
MAFVGLDNLKKQQYEELRRFEEARSTGLYDRIHHSHYDWWMFPIDETSSMGSKWTVSDEDIASLKQDEEFMQHLRRGVEILMESWGWNLQESKLIEDPHPMQKWMDWPVRLYKAGRCMQLFGEEAIFSSLLKFAEMIESKGADLKFQSSSLKKRVHVIQQWKELGRK